MQTDPVSVLYRRGVGLCLHDLEKGESAGPDGMCFEALKEIFAEDGAWVCKVADMYGDALYKGHLPNSSDSVTTLLAKQLQPQFWVDTGPMTLSCTLLKIPAQLLLLCGRPSLVDTHGVQWSEQGQQTGEVIFMRRRISGMTVLKLDIRKALGSAVQSELGNSIFRRVAVMGGRPWEPRLWQLVQCEELLLQTDGGTSWYGNLMGSDKDPPIHHPRRHRTCACCR